MAGKMKPDKKQHIQVFTRVRPLSSQELRSQVVVECISPKEVCVKDKNQTKTFTFDKVFAPDSKQVDVYKSVVNPLISEVLQGYNCTVFAYGQTGTGKTFTMVGDKSHDVGRSWEDDPSCGIIPRALSHLFDELKLRGDEFTVKVSYLELYNEELCDLLAPNVSDDTKTLRLYEDAAKKGSVIVSGLEERIVHNKDDVYTILEAGNQRRQTAATLINAQSSRSHTIFTITVLINVTTPEGEDLIKTGKLNLVDLAGSENIGRSGAVEMRAREAGNINQSLLTLGRVITCLVERAPHVPYRESKLTRILQDSLGGRTKTSIIATVSPALCNIEETLSTFDYAHRARNITTKPEINQKTFKRVLLKEYTEEIERLRRDLTAAREKDGVYLSPDNYNAMVAEMDYLKKELVSKLNLNKAKEEELARNEEMMRELNNKLRSTEKDLESTRNELAEAKRLCAEKEDMLRKLSQQSDELLKAADAATADVRKLHDRLDRSRGIKEQNITSSEEFKIRYCGYLQDMKNRTKAFLTSGVNDVYVQMDTIKRFSKYYRENHEILKGKTINLRENIYKLFDSNIHLFLEQTSSAQWFLNEQLQRLKTSVHSENDKALLILGGLLEFSTEMNEKWNELRSKMLENKGRLEEQSNDLQKMEKESAKLATILTGLVEMVGRKIGEQEEIKKQYQEKLSLLEEKERKSEIEYEESVRRLLLCSQEFMDRAGVRKERSEALKQLRAETNEKISNVMNDAMNSLQDSVEMACEHKAEAENLTAKALKGGRDVLECLDVQVLDSIEEMFTLENTLCTTVDNSVKTAIEERNTDFGGFAEHFEGENLRMKELSEHALENSRQNLESMYLKLEEINTDFENQISSVDTYINENLNMEQNLSSKITGHSEELFSNIHHRVKEIESFFSEGLQKDEKTGETPQRREFIYPKRILTLTPRNRIEPEDETNNVVNKKLDNRLDVENLSEDKENVSDV